MMKLKLPQRMCVCNSLDSHSGGGRIDSLPGRQLY
jgi:hypothetical protein